MSFLNNAKKKAEEEAKKVGAKGATEAKKAGAKGAEEAKKAVDKVKKK